MPQGQGSVILSLLGGLFLFALVLFLAWFCSRWIGQHYGFQKSGGKIRVLDRAALGQDRSLVVVQMGGKAWLLGVTAHQITKIEELDPEQIEEEEPVSGGGSGEGFGASNFSAALQNALKGWLPEKKKEKDKLDE